MGFIDDADRHQEQATLHVHVIGQVEFDIRLFQLHFTGLAFADQRMLDFQFREETDLAAEFVGEIQHEAVVIHLAAGFVEIVVMQFTVAADAGLAVAGQGDLFFFLQCIQRFLLRLDDFIQFLVAWCIRRIFGGD